MNDPTLHELLRTGLRERGITAQADGDDLAGRFNRLTITLPDDTVIWTSGHHARIDVPVDDIDGVSATHHLGDPWAGSPDDEINVYGRAFDSSRNRLQVVEELVDAIATYVTNWPKSPAARHPERPVAPQGVMHIPAKLLRPGDVIVHTTSGHESLVTHTMRLGAGQYWRTVQTITPATRGPLTAMPATWWQFPSSLRCSGSQWVSVVANRHIDPDTLPRPPYPEIPALYDGDRVVHNGRTWERTNGEWFKQNRKRRTEPTSDQSIVRLFTDPRHLRDGIPTHQPAEETP
ncbi:hypothetical protein ACFYUY_04785 [Kitasatospora sp. NPDC004745]|uniref:hypothetical protein n=1 Tax=Kitasatospora sp. NPDC004745 TaxID=3364019 RepID=UPI0036CD530E